MGALQQSRRERISLLATNTMRIAGIQGVYGDPSGVDIVAVSVADALCAAPAEIVLIDAGSTSQLFELLTLFHNKSPLIRVVVIGVDADETYIECVIAAGAMGFVGPEASVAEFAVALENVRDGSIWAPRKVLSRMIASQMAHRTSVEGNGKVRFTPREDQIVDLLIGGQSNRDIGEQLGIDAVTVKAHLGRLMRKTCVVNRIELTMYVLNRRAEERRNVARLGRPRHGQRAEDIASGREILHPGS